MRSCVRCSSQATSSLAYSYASREVWLSDGDGGSALCETHAARMTPPVGWVLHDRRRVLEPPVAEHGVA